MVLSSSMNVTHRFCRLARETTVPFKQPHRPQTSGLGENIMFVFLCVSACCSMACLQHGFFSRGVCTAEKRGLTLLYSPHCLSTSCWLEINTNIPHFHGFLTALFASRHHNAGTDTNGQGFDRVEQKLTPRTAPTARRPPVGWR